MRKVINPFIKENNVIVGVSHQLLLCNVLTFNKYMRINHHYLSPRLKSWVGRWNLNKELLMLLANDIKEPTLRYCRFISYHSFMAGSGKTWD